MKVLMISTDRNILKEGSAVRDRMVGYGKDLEELNIIIFSSDSLNLKNEQLCKNIFVYPTNSKTKVSYISDSFKIASDILNSENVENWKLTCQDPFETGLVGVFLKRKFRIPFEVQIHTDLHSKYFCSFKLGFKLAILNCVRRFLASLILPKADSVRVVSKRIAESLSPKFKVEIKPIAINDRKIIETVKNNEDDLHIKYPQFEKIVLMASRLSSEKNIKLAIQAFRYVIKKNPNVGLVIVGSGPLSSRLKLKVKNLRLKSNIIFENWKEDMISYYKTADIFLNTSFYEGRGMSMEEANIAGCKIVSTDVGIAPEIAVICRFDAKDVSEKIIENI